MLDKIKSTLKFLLLLNLLLLLSTDYAQESKKAEASQETFQQVEIAGSQVRKLPSDITGETYLLYVGLPRSYNDTEKNYPVLYVMDADGSFGTYTELSRLLALNNEVPEIIIVGIAYGVSFKEYLYNRQRDYTPTVVDKYQGSGGGEIFSEFIHKELIPFIDKEYRVEKSERAISGFSYGGLLVLYTLFQAPQLFNRYHAGSTAFWWDNKVTFEFEKNYSDKNAQLPIRLFLTVGSLENKEGYLEPHNKFSKILKSRNYSGLEFDTIILENETHYSNCGNAITKALKWLYNNYDK
jgi:predicted alpha/beta superfamily hydrolase